MNKFLFTVVTLVIGFYAQSQSAKDIAPKIDQAMKAFDQVGAVVGIIENDEVVFTQAYGNKNRSEGSNIDTETVFQLASLSKAFTAASIGILVDRKLLNWDDLVMDHLPAFKLHDAYVSRAFKVKDLLAHRNGYNTFDGDLLWYESAYSTEEILERFAKLEPKHGFREKYGYSNLMFIWAAQLIEAKSGQTWEDFVQKEIFTPLGMKRSFTHFNDFEKLDNKAHPHIEKLPDNFRDYNNAQGAVGVKSCVSDLLKWANMWLNMGLHKGDTLLQPSTVNYILNAHTAKLVSAGNKMAGKYYSAAGLGWFIDDEGAITTISHSGGLPGLILNLCLVPEKKAAMVVLTNDETLFPFALTNEYLELLQGADQQDWISLYKPSRLDQFIQTLFR